LVAGHTKAEILSHYQALLDSGQEWVNADGKDGIQRMAEGWVKHLFSISPPVPPPPKLRFTKEADCPHCHGRGLSHLNGSLGGFCTCARFYAGDEEINMLRYFTMRDGENFLLSLSPELKDQMEQAMGDRR
jgi:hypothetical protein